jgi:hypothetical protein
MKGLLSCLAFLLFASTAFAQSPGGPASGTGYPPGAQAYVASATGTTSATVTVNQSATQSTYLCTLTMSESGGSAISAAGSVTNVSGTTLNFAQLGQLVVPFTPCLLVTGPGSGSNMVGTTPTATAATNSAITLSGYRF